MVLLGDKGLLKDIGQILVTSDLFGCLPFKWNKTTKKLETKTRNSFRLFKIRVYMTGFYLLVVFIQIFRVWKISPFKVIIHNVMFFTTAFVEYIFHLVNYFNNDGVVALCNSLSDHEQRHHQTLKEGKPTKMDILVKLLMRQLTSTALSMPIIYNLDIIRNPCFPMYAGYWLSEQCDEKKLGSALNATWSVTELSTKVGISLWSYLTWSWLLTGCCFHISVELLLHGHCIRSYIASYGRSLLKATKVDDWVRVNSLSFRELQIMTIQYRLNYSKFLLGSGVPCFMLMETICLYNTVSWISGKDAGLSLGYNLLYMCSGFTCLFIIIFVVGMLSIVHDESTSVNERLKGNLLLKRNKWFRRWLKSCPILKIYFGDSNYLDRLTPLTLEDFVINQTVSLLLLN